jgi:tetratricopeptide (TPR) repeat protein
MKIRTALVLVLLVVLVFVGRRVLAADEAWNTRMQAMAAAVTCLAPFVSSDEKFNDLKNHLQINSCVDDLWAQTKDLKDGLTKHAAAHSSDALMQKDPLIPYMASSFAEDVEIAHSLVNSPTSSAYAQHLLRGTLSYCAGCHTRQEAAATVKFPVFKDMTKDLPLTDRMKLLAATRNFDQALTAFDQAIGTKETEKLSSLDLERAVRLALSIAIRVDKNNDAALKLIGQVEKLPKLSPAFKEELATWKTSLKTKDSPVAGTQLQKAKSMIEKAEATHDGYQVRVPQVEYLKASSLLHGFLATNPVGAERAEAMYLLGDCYDHLETLGFWSMSEIYYESCVRSAPHTEIAQRCFTPYKDSITIGYSGSAGINIPANIQSNIRELETLAKRAKSKPTK